MQFNEGQQAAIEGLKQDLLSPGVYGLLGGAGRGKTTVFQEVIKNYRQLKPGSNIAVVAPTNKAVQVAKRAGVVGDIHYSTIHSLLGLTVNEDEGKKVLERSTKEVSLDNCDLIVVDEASMVAEDLVDSLLSQVSYRTSVLGVMDEYQLPPVKEPMPSFPRHFQSSYRLTENMRQGESSPQSVIVEDCLQAVMKGSYNYDPRYNSELFQKNENGGSWLLSGDVFNKVLADAFSKAYQNKCLSKVKFIAFFHNTIESVNAFIRQAIFGDEAIASPYIAGEPLIALSPVIRKVWSDKKGKTINEIKISTAGEAEVLSSFYNIVSVEVGGEIKCYPAYEVTSAVVGGDYLDLILPTPESKITWKEDLKNIKDKCIKKEMHWSNYYRLAGIFDDVRVAYGVTVYSSQGSTYESIFIAGGDLSRVKNFDIRNRSWYVATSRASKKIILC